MNIVIFGAGAIGSLFGALLSKKNDVLLIGREPHISVIKKSRLTIKGKTNFNKKLNAATSIDDIKFNPDLLILTVKSYDTENAIKLAKKIINKDTTVLSLQNGLDNIEKIKKFVDLKSILAGVTTHGALFDNPGIIQHTGIGTTIIGNLNGTDVDRLNEIVNNFNQVGIKTFANDNILKEIWIKAIINSSINPLTTFFQCKNGYLLKNPILEKLVEKICNESTSIANSEEINLSFNEMIKKTKEVIRNTSENYSSMLQSFKKGKKIEVDSINGRLVAIGKNHGADTSLNDLLIYTVNSLVK